MRKLPEHIVGPGRKPGLGEGEGQGLALELLLEVVGRRQQPRESLGNTPKQY